MSRRILPFILLAIVQPGCVPLEAPIADLATSEQDKRLYGQWIQKDEVFPDRSHVYEIGSAADVKGNPKGLMVIRSEEKGPSEYFIPIRIGDETYLQLISTKLDLGQSDQFAKWQAERKPLLLIHVRIDGDTLMFNGGEMKAYQALKKEAGGKKPTEWLTEHLKKHGPKLLFPVEKQQTMTRKTG